MNVNKNQIKIEKATAREVKKFNNQEWHKADKEHYSRKVGRNEWKAKRFILKLTIDEEIVGTISGKHLGGVVHVDSIIVAGEQRRKGFGKAMMEKAEEFAKSLDAHKIHLIAGKRWQANEFYKKMGYKKMGELPKHHFKHDFVIYSKFI